MLDVGQMKSETGIRLLKSGSIRQKDLSGQDQEMDLAETKSDNCLEKCQILASQTKQGIHHEYST
jgi:hypothetical protein